MAGLAAIGLIALMAIYAGVSGVVASRGIRVPRNPLKVSAAQAFPDLTCQEVTFLSRDGIKLCGWYLPGGKSCAIILMVGGYENRLDEHINTPALARDLALKGYAVLLFDQRGRGESAGEGMILTGVEEDIGGAVDFLQNQGFLPDRICILGFSLGAVCACIYALRNPVKALILDGCLADLRQTFRQGARLLKIPSWLAAGFLPGIFTMSRVIYRFNPINPLDIISEIKPPIMFIHEEKDEIIGWEEVRSLYRKSCNPANQIWQVKEAGHSQSYRVNPVEYVERLDQFLSSLND